MTPHDKALMLCNSATLCKVLWPRVYFYPKQWDVINSVRCNTETFVRAAHQVGKDYVAGFIVLWYYLVPGTECRIITTSVKDDHLRVLWGEIGRYLDTAIHDLRKGPLIDPESGAELLPKLIVNHRDIRKVVNGVECKISYLRGMVSESGEGMAGHHATRTLLVVDEASGVDDLVYNRAQSWAKKLLVFGNPYPCSNFFYKGCEGGDVAVTRYGGA